MSGRSLAFLLTGLCTVVTIGLVGATQSSATNQAAAPPTLTPQDSGTTQSLIAVSPVNKRVVWASGRAGTFAVTTNGGATWRSGVVPGASAAVSRCRGRERHGRVSALDRPRQRFADLQDNRRWRDVVAAVPEPGSERILRLLRLLDAHAGFCPERLGERAVPGGANDERQTWQSIAGNEPAALPGESFFASSGTCVATQGKDNAWAVTGGASPSRVLVTRDGGDTWNAYDSPLRGSPSAGAFSVAFRDPQHGMVGGGDLDPAAPPFDQTATSSDGGKTWSVTPQQPNIGTVFGLSYSADAGKASPHGRTVLVTGPGGAAWTPDEGDTWSTLPGVTNYWGVAFGSPQTAWLVGTGGRILRVDFKSTTTKPVATRLTRGGGADAPPPLGHLLTDSRVLHASHRRRPDGRLPVLACEREPRESTARAVSPVACSSHRRRPGRPAAGWPTARR